MRLKLKERYNEHSTEREAKKIKPSTVPISGSFRRVAVQCIKLFYYFMYVLAPRSDAFKKILVETRKISRKFKK